LTRQDAYQLLTEYIQNPNLIKHALAVEAAMRFYARKLGGDEELWGITGLLHDFDYEKWPTAEDHPFKGSQILQERGYPEEMVYAILAHGDHTGLPRQSILDKALYAVDELTGFIVAVALMRPGKSLAEVNVSSVRKKMKDKAFARNVSREDLVRGAEDLGIPLDDHIANVIQAMQRIASELGL